MKRSLARPRRWRPVLLAGGAAVVLHLLVLGTGAARSALSQPLRAPPLQARWVAPPPLQASANGPDEPLAATPDLPTGAPFVPRAPHLSLEADTVAVPRPQETESTQPAQGSVPATTPEELGVANPDPEPDPSRTPPLSTADEGVDPPVLLAAANVPALAPPGRAADAGDEGAPVPVYATRVAPALRLSYRLQRGMVSGTAVLDWQHDAAAQASGAPGAHGAYELRLDARAGPLTLLSQHSQGRFDAAGLAPSRFTDQRLRGGQKAANFQRQRGVVSFSGPPVEYPLVPGVQDRLSWMLQLPAIVSALPARVVATEPIVLQVIGARGDLAVWSFRLAGKESVLTDGGVVPALKFLREPRKPNDTQVEVWLDPALHHLPVRARIGSPPDGEVFELIRLAR